MTTDETPAERAERRRAQRVEAGRKGGTATRDRYGVEFLAAIGKKGGRLGGLATKERHGTEHYSRIGRIGGKAPTAAERIAQQQEDDQT